MGHPTINITIEARPDVNQLPISLLFPLAPNQLRRDPVKRDTVKTELCEYALLVYTDITLTK